MKPEILKLRLEELKTRGMIERMIGVKGEMWRPTDSFMQEYNQARTEIQKEYKTDEERRITGLILALMRSYGRPMEENAIVQSVNILSAMVDAKE